MWLTVLPVFGSLLTIAASQSCAEDSTLLVRLKPLGQCKDGEDTCSYHITIPPLTIQLPKSFSEIEKMVRELEHLTQMVNQLRHDCQECKERQRLAWNLRTADRDNGEGIQASRSTLNQRERQQDVNKRVEVVQQTTRKSADDDTVLSSGTKEMKPTDLERQVWNNRLRKINPSSIRYKDETSGGPKGSNPLQNKRTTESMSKVGKKPLPKTEERTKLSQDGEESSHHGKHKSSGIKVGLGKHTGGNLTKHFRLESLPVISEVTKVSKLDSAEPKQPTQSIKDKILGEIRHAADIREQNDRKRNINVTELSRAHSQRMEDNEEVSDTELKDTIPHIFDSINVALESSTSVAQHPTYKNKDSKHGSGVDSKQLNIVDAVSGLEMLRSPTSDRADVTGNVSQIYSYLLRSHSKNTFDPGTEAGSTSDLTPVITNQTVSQEDQSSRIDLREIHSPMININPKSPVKPETYAEIDTKVESNPDNTEAVKQLKTSKSPMSAITDEKYNVSQLNLDRKTKNTFKPLIDKEKHAEMESVKLTDTLSIVEMPRSPMSIITHSSVMQGADKRLINPQNTINRTREAKKDFGTDFNQVNTPETQLETSTAPMSDTTDFPADVSEIDSTTMDRGSGNLGGYLEMDDEMDLNPAETVHGLEMSRSSHSAATVGTNPQSWHGNDDLLKGRTQLQPNLNMTKPVSEPIGNSNTMTMSTETKYVLRNKKTTQSRTDAGNPNLLTPNTESQNNSRVSSTSLSSAPVLDLESIISQAGGRHPERTLPMDEESSGIPQPSGGYPVSSPGVNQGSSGTPQPTAVFYVKVTALDQEPSAMPHPSEVPPVSIPTVDQEPSVMPQSSQVLSVNAPALDQETSANPQPSKVLLFEVPVVQQKTNVTSQFSGKHTLRSTAVDQETSGMAQPSGVLLMWDPAVDQRLSGMPLPSSELSVKAPAEDQESSGKSQPSGVPPPRSPAVNLMSGRIPQPSGVLPIRAPTMDLETSGTPQTSTVLSYRAPAMQKKTNVMPQPSGKLPLSTPTVDQELSGTPRGSGVLPVRAPAVDEKSSAMQQHSGVLPVRTPAGNHKSSEMFQPSGSSAIWVPSVDEKASGLPKPTGVLDFRIPVLEQKTDGKTQPRGILPFRDLFINQNTSSLPQVTGVPFLTTEQKTHLMQRPSKVFPARSNVMGQDPKRFMTQKNMTFPKYMNTLQKTHPARVMLVKKPTLKRPYILQRIQGNKSVEAFPETLGSEKLKNKSRVPGHTMDISSPQNRSTGTVEETSNGQKEFSYHLSTAATWYMKLMKDTKDKHSTMTTTTAETSHLLDHDHGKNAKTSTTANTLDKPVHHRLSSTNLDGASRSSSGKMSASDLGSTELHLDVGGSGKVTVSRPDIQNKANHPKHGAMDIIESPGTNVSTSERYIKTPLKSTEPVEVYSGDGQPTDGNSRKSNPVAEVRTEETEATQYNISSKLTIVKGTKKPVAMTNVGGKEGLEKQLVSNCNGKCDLGPSPQPIPNIYKSSADEQDIPAQDCSEITMKNPSSGVYNLTVSENCTFSVVCDMNASGGGWTLIQRRWDGSVSFSRTWEEYKKGFGNLSGEFWLGNDKIHSLTSAKPMVLRIELEDLDGIKEYAQYEHFHVASESHYYRLTIGKYSGTAGNAMQYSKKFNHDQKYFSTPDRDNDQYSSGNCGAFYRSGWWFDACMAANLNGRYYHKRYKGVRNGIFWGTWHNISAESYPTTDRQAFKAVRMMIRPRAG